MATTPQDCGAGAGAGGPDVEQTLLCDIDDQGNVVGTAIAVYQYDENGAPVGAPTFVNPTTGDPYVAQGTMQPCGESVEVEQQLLCDEQPDNSVVRFIRHYVYNEGVFERTYETNLDGSVYNPVGTVTECEPDAICTPSPAVDLQAECGPGEAPDAQFIAEQGVASDARVDTDAAADGLCGGTWVRPGDPQNAPFPIEESFRNAAFDQPGPVTQGTNPYFALTADPANAGLGGPPAIPADAVGQGWGRMSDQRSFSNGFWQVPTAFPTAQGMTMEITVASHTGTQPQGGDGWVVGFTDGASPAQGAAVGGGGSLGLANWEGGYVGVVIEEFGGTGAGANTISIQGIGANQGNIIANQSILPNRLNSTTRATPARVRTSIIEQFGETYVSASVDWNDGNGFIQYFDRVRVDNVIGASPATLRMGVNGSSGGAFRSVKEVRDAEANQGGVQYWRGFPITTDPLEDCIETVDIAVAVDHTFDAASEVVGNGEPDAWLWIVNEADGTVLAQRQWSSNPNNLGQAQERTAQVLDVDPADLPNIRIYVGAETRDAGETFDHTWDNLRVTVTGQGCPAEPVRTVPISAPCPIPVTIVGGDAEGGGGGQAVFEAPSTFQYAPICMTVDGETQPGFIREVRSPDGETTQDFLGEDGLPVVPEQWTPGSCSVRDTEIVMLCDTVPPFGNVVPFMRRFTFNENGDVVEVDNLDADGNPYTIQGNVTICGLDSDDGDRERICYTLNGDEDTILVGWARHDDDLQTPFTVNGITFFDGLGNPIDPNANQFTQVPCGGGGTLDPADPLALQSHLADLSNGEQWLDANVAGQLVSVSFTILSGTATVTDQDGTVTSNIPAGTSLSWSVLDQNNLDGPNIIEANGAGARVLVNYTTRN